MAYALVTREPQQQVNVSDIRKIRAPAGGIDLPDVEAQQQTVQRNHSEVELLESLGIYIVGSIFSLQYHIRLHVLHLRDIACDDRDKQRGHSNLI